MLLPYFYLARQALLSNLRRLPRPFKLTFALTYRCNFRCWSCRTWRRPPAPEMTAAEVGEFFRRQDYFSWVDLTGGEITLRPDLNEVVEAVTALSRRLIVLHFPTNAYLPARVISAVRAAKRRPGLKIIVTVSLDGPAPVHDRLRGVEGSWERALETFAALRREKGVEVFLGTTLQEGNLHLRAATIASVRKRIPGVRESDFHFNFAQRAFFYDNLDLAPAPGSETSAALDEIAAGFRGRASPRQYLERVYLAGARRFLATGVCPLSCRALSNSCFVDPYGNVYPCSGYDRPLGNLRAANFELDAIWRRPETRATQREIAGGSCPQCWTPCEAYQTILGNLFRRWRPARREGGGS
jgi:radical SAM protein with 4Fe4S-binding SPASM domain